MTDHNHIHILCHSASPRLTFVANFISSATGIIFRVSPACQATTNDHHERMCINYTERPVDSMLSVFASGFMTETGIRPMEPDVIKQQGHAFLFPAPRGFDIPFDLFSAIFYLLSRYEEYLPFVPDRYGRFEANQSLAFQHGFLEEPVIDQWLVMLKTGIKQKFPGLPVPEQHYRFMSTFDVDNPWAILHKGFFHTSAGLLKQALLFNFNEIHLRLSVLRGTQADPFDTYDYIRQIEDRYQFRSTFFFLSGNRGPYDSNYALEKTAFRELLTLMKNERETGIHPSYRSGENENVLAHEFNRFAKILGRKPEISRLHYLLLKFPQTYQRFISLGIKADYSMGYASLPGFRAGTTLPFRFYDLSHEQETSLLIHPFAMMDVTLQQYAGLAVHEATEQVKRLIGKVRSVQGIFTSLWHNESLSEQSEWKGWRNVFESMVEEGNR